MVGGSTFNPFLVMDFLLAANNITSNLLSLISHVSSDKSPRFIVSHLNGMDLFLSQFSSIVCHHLTVTWCNMLQHIEFF